MGGCDALDHYTHPRTPSMCSLLRSLSLACHHPRTHSPLRSPSRRHGPPPIKRARRPVSSYGPRSHLTHDALDYEFQACRNHRQLEQLLSRSLKGAYSRLARVNIYSGYLVSLPSESQTGLKVPHVIHKYIRNFLCDPGWTPPGVYPIRETKKGQDQFARKHLFVGPLLPSGF